MKKITFIALHLGYGGIEKCISKVTDMLSNDYEIEILSIYKIYPEPQFDINKDVSIKYLIDTDLPMKLNKYKVYLKERKLKLFFSTLYKQYIKKCRIIQLLTDFTYGAYISGRKREKALAKYVAAKDYGVENIYVTTHMFMNKIVKENTSSKIIAWEHNHHAGNEKYKSDIRQACLYADKLIVVSKDLESFYKKDFIEKDVKCDVMWIPNFVQSSSFDKKYVYEKNKVIKNITSIGRLSTEKGFLDLLDVVKKIATVNSNVVLNIIGDGNQKEELEAKINELELAKNVVMHGFLKEEEVNCILKNTDVYLMTSFTESFGLVILEAMNFNVPVVAFDSAEGAMELIQDGKNGFLISDRDKESMATKVLEVLKEEFSKTDIERNMNETLKIYSLENNKKMWKNVLMRILDE